MTVGPTATDDEDQARAWLTDLNAGWAENTHLSWAIEEEGTVVGYFVIKAANPPKTLATGVGYWTVAEARGKGIASRCVGAATDWLFSGQDIMPADEIELLHSRQRGFVQRRPEVRLRPRLGAHTDATGVPRAGTPAPAQAPLVAAASMRTTVPRSADVRLAQIVHSSGSAANNITS